MTTDHKQQREQSNRGDQRLLPEVLVAAAAPAPTNGESKAKRIRKRQRFDEAISPNAERVFNVRSIDVIFGRGKGYQDHPGNRRMRAIIHQHKEEYKNIARSQKRDLIEAVYSEITQDGARFLHKSGNEDAFVIVDVPIALRKVRNTLRCKKTFNTTSDDDLCLPSAAGAASDSAETAGGPSMDLHSTTSLGAFVRAGTVGFQRHMPIEIASHIQSPQFGSMSSLRVLSSIQSEQRMRAAIHAQNHGGISGNDDWSTRLFAGLGGMQWPPRRPGPLDGGIARTSVRMQIDPVYPPTGSMPLLPLGTLALPPLSWMHYARLASTNASAQNEKDETAS